MLADELVEELSDDEDDESDDSDSDDSDAPLDPRSAPSPVSDGTLSPSVFLGDSSSTSEVFDSLDSDPVATHSFSTGLVPALEACEQ